MSLPKHTPGPWRAVLHVPGRSPNWPADDGTGIHVAESATDSSPRIEIRSSTDHMDGVFGSSLGGVMAEVPITADGLEQAKANGRLLALSPDLLEFVASLENDDGAIPASMWEWRNRLLAKARGES